MSFCVVWNGPTISNILIATINKFYDWPHYDYQNIGKPLIKAFKYLCYLKIGDKFQDN